MLGTVDTVARVYTHCAKTGGGGVVVFGFNMVDKNSQIVNIGETQTIEEYVLSPVGGNLVSKTVMLNNNVLNLVEGKRMPTLQPIITTGSQILIEQGTIGFWVLPRAGNENCI